MGILPEFNLESCLRIFWIPKKLPGKVEFINQGKSRQWLSIALGLE
jgi:hypothetical protein